MDSRKYFSTELAKLDLPHVERAVAFLWYYRNSQEYEERSASELSNDLHDEKFPKPNVTVLKANLKKSKFTIKGKRKDTFQIDIRQLDVLDEKFANLLNVRKYSPTKFVIPPESVVRTRKYIEKLANQINGCYELGFYDGCATLMRRLMESLIIEVYIIEKRKHEIQKDGNFFMLDNLVKYISTDRKVTLSRNIPKIMNDVKQVGDTAAHDRVYITQEQDVDDIKSSYRKLINELLIISKVIK